MNTPSSQKTHLAGWLIVAVILVAGSGFLSYTSLTHQWPWPKEQPSSSVTRSVADILKTITKTPTAQADSFAVFTPPTVTGTPSVQAYTVTANLSNVINTDQFGGITEAQRSALTKNAFVVVPGTDREFFPMYERNRYSFVPNFITTDSLLHTTHLYFDYLLKKTEQDKLVPILAELAEKMQTASAEQYEALKTSTWSEAARRNLAFFSVARRLIDPAASVPAVVKAEVETDLDYIANPPSEMTKPATMLIGNNDKTSLEDFSQYVPRSHYTESEDLQRYWRTMMWFGRLTFLIKLDSEVQSATLMTIALRDSSIQSLWQKIYEPTNFFVGKSDDITYTELNDLLRESYGASFSLATVTQDNDAYAAYLASTITLTPPQINSIPIPGTSLAPASNRDELITGFRFMGQRFTLDASIFQRLICREVGNKDGTTECPKAGVSRMLPSGLDIPSGMGSEEAKAILKAAGEEEYKNYPEQMAKVREGIAKVNDSQWTQNLYWSWLYSLRPIIEQKGTGYPSFMRNSAWDRKGLNSYLGSWAELKHDTLLYSKQAYAELGGGPPDEKDDRGYVEPEPLVFARIAGLVGMMRDGLGQRGLVSEATKANLDKLVQLATDLSAIASKELTNTTLTASDYDLIRAYGGQLEHFWTDVNQEKMAETQVSQLDYLNENPAAIVADVATDPNGQVLEVATGYIDTIYVIVPLDGKLRLTKGGVFSYYEFLHPLNDRLTDKAWRQMLTDNKQPPVPTWTSVYRVAD